jgi:hypothetical protein
VDEPEKKKKLSPLSIGLSTVAVLMLITFIMNNFAVLPALKGLFGPGVSTQGQAYSSLQAATDTCKRRASLQLGENLLKTKLDERSTRYIDESNQYLVYLDITIKGMENKKYYIECRISATNQAVLNIELTGPPREFQQIQIR